MHIYLKKDTMRVLVQWKLVQLFILTLLIAYTTGTKILQSPSITGWGDWGTMEKCPPGTYVIGMQLKVESRQPGLRDDTGLNGIRFFCSDLSATEAVKGTIQSTVGQWGTWRSEFFCNGVVTGFQLRSEPSQADKDDTAANNLRVFCSDGTTIEGEGTQWGSWTSEQKCRQRQAVCALQTQVEMAQGYGTLAGDDTALNNLKVECCDIMNPAENCTPSDHWELVAECDNTNAFTPTTCSYERKVGIGYSALSRNPGVGPGGLPNNHERTVLESIGFNLGIEAQVLSQKFHFETGTSQKTGYEWGSSKTDTWDHETSTKVSFDVPPGVKTSMVQVIGACGLYLIRTSKFQRIDTVGTDLMDSLTTTTPSPPPVAGPPPTPPPSAKR